MADPVVEHVFLAYTTSHSASEPVSWRNVLYGLSQVMKATPDDRAALSLSLGAMDSTEVMGMLLAGSKDSRTAFAQVHDMNRALDKNGDGTVTIEEFKVCSHIATPT